MTTTDHCQKDGYTHTRTLAAMTLLLMLLLLLLQQCWGKSPHKESADLLLICIFFLSSSIFNEALLVTREENQPPRYNPLPASPDKSVQSLPSHSRGRLICHCEAMHPSQIGSNICSQGHQQESDCWCVNSTC